MSYPLRSAAAVTALGLAGAAVWTFSGSDAGTERDTVALGRIANVALTTNHDCADLLDYYRTQAAKMVGPYGVDGGPQIATATDLGVAGKLPVPSAARAAAGSESKIGADSVAAGAPDSATNVQVAGVDESDVVKTNGDVMVSVINGEIRITRLAGAGTKTLATWRPAEGAAQSVLLDGRTAVVIGDQNGGIPLGAMKLRAPGPEGYNAAVTDLTVLDLTDPAHPRPVRRLELGGTRSGEARLVDGELRVALTAGPTGITWKQPLYPNNPNLDQAKAQAKFEQAEKQATAANKKLIAKSTIADWIPQATVTPLNAEGKPAGPAVKRPLLDCAQVAIPGSFSGLSTLALVSTDLHAESPLSSWRSAGVIADGSTVYATADHVWLATSRWDAMPVDGRTSLMGRFAPSASTTQIHRFDTPLRGQPTYLASGEIAGTLLNQFAMDEKDGLLRVASTTEGASAPASPVEDSAASGDTAVSSEATDGTTSGTSDGTTGTTDGTTSGTTSGTSDGTTSGTSDTGVASDGAAGDGVIGGSTGTEAGQPLATTAPANTAPGSTPKPTPKLSEGWVTVLAVDGKRLTTVGAVTGLGRGELIRGVRFVGDVGYVVTYRQTDPLYTVDLSDPAKPQVRGELAVLGYSAYLHPAGDGRLLGLGQDGTEGGRSTGLQLSLFDVSDLGSPTRLDRVRLAEAWSDAESDHHAFTMAGDLVLIPYNSWTSVASKNGSEKVDGNLMNRFDAGVIAVRVGADGLGTPSTLRPIAGGPITFDGSASISPSVQRITESTPMRTVVHDGTIYTLTSSGVAAHSATDFHHLAFAKF